MTAVDFLYAEYTKGIRDFRTIYASTMAMMMLGANALVVSLYVHNPYTIAAAALGAFFGTYLSMRFFK